MKNTYCVHAFFQKIVSLFRKDYSYNELISFHLINLKTGKINLNKENKIYNIYKKNYAAKYSP